MLSSSLQGGGRMTQGCTPAFLISGTPLDPLSLQVLACLPSFLTINLPQAPSPFAFHQFIFGSGSFSEESSPSTGQGHQLWLSLCEVFLGCWPPLLPSPFFKYLQRSQDWNLGDLACSLLFCHTWGGNQVVAESPEPRIPGSLPGIWNWRQTMSHTLILTVEIHPFSPTDPNTSPRQLNHPNQKPGHSSLHSLSTSKPCHLNCLLPPTRTIMEAFRLSFPPQAALRPSSLLLQSGLKQLFHPGCILPNLGFQCGSVRLGCLANELQLWDWVHATSPSFVTWFLEIKHISPAQRLLSNAATTFLGFINQCITRL